MNTKFAAFLAVALVTVAASDLLGQANWNGGDGNWNDTNWSGGAGPNGSPAENESVTFPSTTGTVAVTNDVYDDAGAFGTLKGNGGVLAIDANGRVDFGQIDLADAADSTATIVVNGELNASAINVGMGGGGAVSATGILEIAGAARVRVANDLDTWWAPGAQLTVTGDNADIEVGGTFYLGTSATMVANIGSDSFSTINVPGTVNFAGGTGTLEVNFVDGYAPTTVGSSWVLFDAANRGGTIPILDLPDAGVGGLLNVNYSEGGELGNVVTLDYTNTLNLKVDTTSGLATIENPLVGGVDLDIDGYIIRSDSGALAQDSLVGLGAGWLPGLAPSQSAELISETNFDASTVITQGQSYPIGNVFAVGGANDFAFEYHLANGVTLPGTVEFVGGGLLGDYDNSGALDVPDLDLQAAAIAGGQNPPEYDLNGDGVVDYEGDRIRWVKELKNTWIGDADLNGEFDSLDFVAVFVAGKYETGDPASWGEGDWDANLVFDSSDFVASFVDGGYEQGLVPGAVQAVPEPASALLMLLGLIALVWRRR